MLRNSDLIRKVENGQVKMLLVTQEPNGPLRWRGDMIRLNAIMGNVDLCKSIEEAFKVESKNNGNFCLTTFLFQRMKKLPNQNTI